MNIYERELNHYLSLNQVAKRNSVVVFGSTFLKNIPVSELAQTFDLRCDMYNRSFIDLSIFDAKELLEQSVLPLLPQKVMLGLGETDLAHGFKTIPEIIEAYSSLIDTIHESNKNCEIIIVSVCNHSKDLHPEELNRQLEKLAKANACTYVDITSSLKSSATQIKAFQMLKLFALDKISFNDAMAYIF